MKVRILFYSIISICFESGTNIASFLKRVTGKNIYIRAQTWKGNAVKKLATILFGMAMIVFLVEVAPAMPITFTNTTSFGAGGTAPAEDLNSYGVGDVNRLDGFLDFVSWTHHYNFTPPAENVVSGSLKLYLRDDNDYNFEFGIGRAEDGTWDIGEVDTASYSYDVTASFLGDGAFSVILISLGGDFFIDRSELTITYNPAPPADPVPEPATMLLLGTGLLGMVAVRRKHFIKKD